MPDRRSTQGDLKALIDRHLALSNELRRRSGCGEAELAHPRDPATESALASFEKRFERDVPPSFLALLALHDGIDRFEWMDLTLYGTEYLLEHPDLDESWIDAGKARPGELFVFGWAESDATCLAFERNHRRDDGEMPVVHFDARGELWHGATLEAYLRQRIEWFVQAIANER